MSKKKSEVLANPQKRTRKRLEDSLKVKIVLKATELQSAWMEKGGHWIMSLLNVYGGQ